MSTIDEINKALEILKNGKSKIAILHCISAYPTKEKDANLAALSSLINSFPDFIIGHSDHTDNIRVPLYAVAAGAQILEKHFKITDDMECIDASVSISEEKFSNLVKETRMLEAILGNGIPQSTEVQKNTEQYRRFKN